MMSLEGGTERILVVDDEEMNIRLLKRILSKAGYQHVAATSNGEDVERLIAEFDPALMLLDLHMPGRDGFMIMKALSPRLAGGGSLQVIVLTGDGSLDSRRNALSLGARDFISKPFDAAEVLLRIRNLLEMRSLFNELKAQNDVLETRVAERTRDLELSHIEVMERLARATEVRDDNTGRHTQRVGELSARLALALGMEAETAEVIGRAAPLHDLGKIGIPDDILLKPDGLTDEETTVMRTHTTRGAGILSGSQSDLLVVAERIALSHHERWDGSGYPYGLAGEAIPIEARIVGVADCVDALTHKRLYREAWTVKAVLEELRRERGKHFDPHIIDVFLESDLWRTLPLTPPRPNPALETGTTSFRTGRRS